MPTVLQVVHGFPPREVAGTELATARLVTELVNRGWTCHVVSATRAPGHRQYAVLEQPGVTRIVQNLVGGLLGSDADAVVERVVGEVVRKIRPDVVHVQHLAWLSTGLRFPVPSVGTLHDHWPWCPAGGTLVRFGRTPCPGPDPAVCPACSAAFFPPTSPWEEGLVRIARRLSGWIPPDRLHAAYRGLPVRWRALLRERSAPRPTATGDLQRRQEAHRDAWNRMDVRLAPSRYLADAAERHGLGPVRVIPNGVGPFQVQRRVSGGPLVYLGTLAPHKGVHLVVAAARRVAVPLRVVGDPSTDPAYARGLGVPLSGPVPPAEVPALLASARALVLGSIWPENAPLTILEARAVGCPVIAPSIGGIPELVEDGTDGFLYPPGDVDGLTQALRRLVDAPPLPVRPPPTISDHVDAVEAVYRALLR